MTLTTQVLGTTLLTLGLLGTAMWANGIPPVATPHLAACLDPGVTTAAPTRAATPSETATCGDTVPSTLAKAP